MEGKDSDIIGNLLKDVNNLESKTKKVNQEINEIINNLKPEEQKKNWYDGKIDELKQSVNFYKMQVAKMSKILISKKKICVQFELALECYDRLIGMYEETLKPQSKFDMHDLSKITETNTNQVQQEIEQCKINIQKNLIQINDLLPPEILE